LDQLQQGGTPRPRKEKEESPTVALRKSGAKIKPSTLLPSILGHICIIFIMISVDNIYWLLQRLSFFLTLFIWFA